MKKSWAMKWVKALRSGKYKQGQGCLRGTYFDNSKAYCCLGVLCELTKTKGLNNIVLSKKEMDITGVKTDVGNLPIYKNKKILCYGKALSTLNDKGKSFKHIANLIEKYYKDI